MSELMYVLDGKEENFYLVSICSGICCVGTDSGNEWAQLSSVLLFRVEFLTHEELILFDGFLFSFFLLPTGDNTLSNTTVQYFCCPPSPSTPTAFPDLCCSRVDLGFLQLSFSEINHRGRWEGWRIHLIAESRGFWVFCPGFHIGEKKDRI